MAYTDPDFKTKKALRQAVLNGYEVKVFQPGPFPLTVYKGEVSVEGPHGDHKWYARVRVNEHNLVTKVIE